MASRTWARTHSRSATIVATAIAAGLVLTGCAAGQRAQTSSEIASVPGASGQTGSLLIRNAGVAAPGVTPSWDRGSTAPLVLTVVNEGLDQVTLTSVTTNASSAVVLAPATGAPASASASASAPITNSVPTDSAAPSSTAPASTPIAIPGQTSVRIGFTETGAAIRLTNLSRQLFPATTIPVTFAFSNGSSIDLTVPVNTTTDDTDAPTLGVQVSPTENGS